MQTRSLSIRSKEIEWKMALIQLIETVVQGGIMLVEWVMLLLRDLFNSCFKMFIHIKQMKKSDFEKENITIWLNQKAQKLFKIDEIPTQQSIQHSKVFKKKSKRKALKKGVKVVLFPFYILTVFVIQLVSEVKKAIIYFTSSNTS